jgi:hypothetical protein
LVAFAGRQTLASPWHEGVHVAFDDANRTVEMSHPLRFSVLDTCVMARASVFTAKTGGKLRRDDAILSWEREILATEAIVKESELKDLYIDELRDIY